MSNHKMWDCEIMQDHPRPHSIMQDNLVRPCKIIPTHVKSYKMVLTYITQDLDTKSGVFLA